MGVDVAVNVKLIELETKMNRRKKHKKPRRKSVINVVPTGDISQDVQPEQNEKEKEDQTNDSLTTKPILIRVETEEDDDMNNSDVSMSGSDDSMMSDDSALSEESKKK